MAVPQMIPPLHERLLRRQQYWAIVGRQARGGFFRVASDQVFGTRNHCHAASLRLLKQLEFFLGIIEEERHWDTMNDPLGMDRGAEYYILVNEIACIRRGLICRGFDAGLILKIFDIFGLYDLIDTTAAQERDGIGIMALETESGKVFVVS